MRLFVSAVALLLACAVARAEDANKDPILVNPDAVRAQADQLHDAVASPSVTNFEVHQQAAGFFEGLQRETPFVNAPRRYMDRESVDGHEGTIDGMLDEAKKRYDHYKMTTVEPPAPELDAAVKYSRDLRQDKRVDFDKTGKMADNQMGEFRYQTDRRDGEVALNDRMRLLATRIGEAFAYATMVHESGHAKARADGRLDPKRVIDGEVEAYRIQYRWIKIIDPRAERMIVLHSTLQLQVKHHPEDRISKAAIVYLEHLLEVYDTEGDDGKIREMIKRLGYEEAGEDHGGGVNPNATPVRA